MYTAGRPGGVVVNLEYVLIALMPWVRFLVRSFYFSNDNTYCRKRL